MSYLAWILLLTFASGALSALAASVFLALGDGIRRRAVPHMVSFATGALLGAALLGLLPHALETVSEGGYHGIGVAVLGGILLFFTLEKLVLWRHCHADECEAHTPDDRHRDAASGTMVLLGDGLHNFLDGMLIGAAVLTDVHLGVVTAVAVVTHEIPQEMGDLAVLLNGGMSRMRALVYNLLVSLTTVAGGVVAWVWLENSQALQPYVLAVAASSFLYVAVADLIPGLHREINLRGSVAQVVLISVGVTVIYATHSLLH